MKTQIVSAGQGFAALRDAWNELVVDDPTGLLGLDGTSTYEWFDALLATFPEAATVRVVVVRRQGKIVGLLPAILGESAWMGSRLISPTELHGGRNGFRMRDPDSAILAALLKGLDLAWPGWVSLQTTLVAGSESETVLGGVSRSLGSRVAAGELRYSMFFPIQGNSDDFLKGVAKDLRQRIKSAPRKLAALGAVQYHEYRHESQALDLIDAVLRVERLSWKHKAGSAISNVSHQEEFYRAMFPRAMRSGLLYALVVSLDGQPVAYNFGLIRDGVFSSLKISQIESLAKLSLSHMLRFALINRLRSEGVRIIESTGMPEPYKMRWSEASQLYGRRQYLLFNRDLRGGLAFAAGRAKANITRLWAGAKRSTLTSTEGTGSE